MKKAIGYVRVSTTGQAEDGVSLDAQRARIAAWCLANDIELAEVFEDAGLSGKRADNRPGLVAALDAVCRSGGVLVVYSLSRMARSVKDTITITERIDKSGADLVSLTEKIDTTSAAGRMVFRMLAVMAEFERDLVSERTKSAMNHKRSKGQRLGQIPYGFRLVEDGVNLVEDDLEQKTMGLIRQLHAEGLSGRKIVAELNAMGIKTKGNGQWHETTVRRILNQAA